MRTRTTLMHAGRAHVNTDVHACGHAQVCTCAHVRTCAHTHTNRNTHTHTLIHFNAVNYGAQNRTLWDTTRGKFLINKISIFQIKTTLVWVH